MECAICCDAIDPSQSHELRCGHSFHSHCLIDWFSRGNPSCPACRDDQRSYHEQLPRYTLFVRARHLRKKYARRFRIPAEMKRRIEAMKQAEARVKVHRDELRRFRAANKAVLKQHQQLMNKTYAERWKLNDATRLLGLYEDVSERLPALVVDPPL